MFRNKKNKETFKLNINKEQANEEYKEYMSQPPEILESLRNCKIFMAIFIPAGIALTILISVVFPTQDLIGDFITLGVCILVGVLFSLCPPKKYSTSLKIRFVPLICLCTGWTIGQICVQKIITMVIKLTE